MQLGTKLFMGWWIGTKIRITLWHVITFSLTLHCFGFFWRLGCMPQGLAGLIVRGHLVFWLFIQRKDQEDNFGIACMFKTTSLYCGWCKHPWGWPVPANRVAFLITSSRVPMCLFLIGHPHPSYMAYLFMLHVSLLCGWKVIHSHCVWMENDSHPPAE